MSNSSDDDADRSPREDPCAGAEPGGWGEPLFTGLDTICDTAIPLAGADGVVVAVLTRVARVRELAYASDPIAQQLDELQYTIGEGPCFDAYLDDKPQLYPELRSGAQTSRWPTFATDATQLGIQALFAFPIPNGQRPMGVLEFYRRAAGGLDDVQYESAAACAAAIAQQLQSNWRTYVADAGSTERAIETAAVTGIALSAPADPFTRTHIHLAGGMAAVQLGVMSSEGVDRLRAYSYAHGRSISSVAADIIARRLTLSPAD